MTLTLQSILTGVILYIVYLLFGPATYIEVDTINEFVYLVLIPVGLIGTTWILCLLAGLPLRLISSLNKWWKSKQLFVAFIITVGFITLGITLKPDFAEPVFDWSQNVSSSYAL